MNNQSTTSFLNSSNDKPCPVSGRGARVDNIRGCVTVLTSLCDKLDHLRLVFSESVLYYRVLPTTPEMTEIEVSVNKEALERVIDENKKLREAILKRDESQRQIFNDLTARLNETSNVQGQGSRNKKRQKLEIPSLCGVSITVIF